MIDFIEKLKSGYTILLDGAFGTELARRGFDIQRTAPGARALLEAPELVSAIHRDYVEAGAQLLTANTLNTAAVALRDVELERRGSEIIELALSLAQEAADAGDAPGGVDVVAAMGPLSFYFHGGTAARDAELQRAQEDHVAQLALAGVELVLCETMPSVREARSALSAVVSAGLNAIISLVPRDSRHILSGETIDTAVRALEPLGPVAICLNCCPLDVMDSAIASLLSLTSVPVGAYASVRSEKPGDPAGGATTVLYRRHAERWLDFGVRIVGGCCGTTPEHIRALKNKLHFGPPPEDR